MQKKFFKNLVLVLVLNVLIKPFYILGIDAEMLKQIEESSPGAYGEYFSLMSLSFILNIFLDLGITNYNTRNIARHNQLLKKHFAGIFSIRLLLSVFYILILGATGIILGYDLHQFKLLGLLAFNQILVAFILYLRSNLAGLLLFKQDSIVSVVDRLLLIIICAVLLWGGVTDEPIKIEWFIFAQTFSYFATFLFAAYLVIRKTGSYRITLKPAFSWMIIKKSLPYALLILLMTVYYRSDSVMLERMLPDGAVASASYARGYRFFEALNMVGFLFAGLLLPLFARLLKERKEISGLLGFSLKLIMSYALLAGVLTYYYRTEIIAWRFEIHGSELTTSAEAFGIMMLCFIFIAITYIYSTLLTANGNMRLLNYIAATGVVLNIGLNLVLIPRTGVIGAAWASFITQAITTILQIILAHKLIAIRIQFQNYLRILVYLVLVIQCSSFAQTLNLYWLWEFVLVLGIGSLLAILIGLISIRELRTLLSSDEA